MIRPQGVAAICDLQLLFLLNDQRINDTADILNTLPTGERREDVDVAKMKQRK